MNNKRGISLIVLIITIAILIIIAGVTIQNGLQRTNEAKLAKHNTNISTTQEEVESYYYYKGGSLPVVDLTPYPIPSGSTLEAEIIKNAEQDDDFYILDLSKLEKVAGKDGTGAGDDIYIVSATKHTVYYVRGTNIKGLVYHGLGTGNSGGIAQTDGATPTSGAILTPTGEVTLTPVASPTATPTVSPTPTPSSGQWDGMVNSPKLATGLTPVRWNGSAWVDLTPTEQLNENNEWYDYRNTGGTANKWANARLADGSMLVWIPRYTYQISSGEHTSTAGTINIKFSNGITDDTTGGYRIHPAFYWGGWNIPANADMTKQAGGVEIKGIWVGKFEISAANGKQGTLGDKIAIKPNISSWRSVQIGDMFDKCYEMQSLYSSIYGIDTNRSTVDAHMLKNSEWAAAAYLSKYARGTNEVAINDNSSFIGGKGDYAFFTELSTTGTEYGIYDMSGSAWEYVACYINNKNGNLSSYGNSITDANAKYKDVFPVAGTDARTNNYNLTDKAYGHAFWEISTGTGSTGWFGDYTNFMDTVSPFSRRGGKYNDDSNAGVFYFGLNSGIENVPGSWRTSVVVP